MQPISKLPPEDIGASELWARVSQLPRPYEVVDFPRKDPITNQVVGQVAIQVLTEQEKEICLAAAETYSKSLLKANPRADEQNRGYDDIFLNACSVELLARACRDVNNLARPAFPSPKMLRMHLTNNEVGLLMSHYLRIQANFSPYVATLTDEECEAWLSKLEAGASGFFFDYLSHLAKEDLIVFLANRLLSLQMGKSWRGLRRSEPMSESSNTIVEPDNTVEDEFAGKD